MLTIEEDELMSEEIQNCDEIFLQSYGKEPDFS
jgi:hypothetical protein